MSTYAAYHNLSVADRNEKSRRTSEQSTSSATSQPERRRSSIQKVLDHLRPTEEAITPAGIYSPVIKRGSLFSRKSSKSGPVDEKKAKDIRMRREMLQMMSAAA